MTLFLVKSKAEIIRNKEDDKEYIPLQCAYLCEHVDSVKF